MTSFPPLLPQRWETMKKGSRSSYITKIRWASRWGQLPGSSCLPLCLSPGRSRARQDQTQSPSQHHPQHRRSPPNPECPLCPSCRPNPCLSSRQDRGAHPTLDAWLSRGTTRRRWGEPPVPQDRGHDQGQNRGHDLGHNLVHELGQDLSRPQSSFIHQGAAAASAGRRRLFQAAWKVKLHRLSKPLIFNKCEF